MRPELIAAIAVLAVVVAVVFWAVSASNRFKVLLVKITEADSGIDVALTKRYDTLTKLMDVVRAYARHETALFEKVIRLRSGMSMAEKGEVNRRMDEASERISVIAENYPELRSSENYRQLQVAIVDAEDHLQAARRVYNMNVSSFNQAIAVFPANIIARRARHTPKEFFEADEVKRSDVTIDV
jgi:LemA protein